VRFEEPELAARLAARREELPRMAALKTRVIAKINAAQPPLKKFAIGLTGQDGDVLKADQDAITAKTSARGIELHPWSKLSGEKALPKVLQFAIQADKAEDSLTAGMLSLAIGNPMQAEKYFEQARSLGAKIDAYLARLTEALLGRAEALLAAKQFAQAEKAISDLEAKYSQLAWFAANKPAIAAAREVAKAGIAKNQEAEILYAEAARLLAKKELFDVKALVEKLKSDYADTPAARDPRRRPSLPELEKAVAKVPKPITVRLDGKGDFKGIQAAIDASPSGSLIEIEDNGPYHEKLLIPKDKYELRVRGKKGCWPVITSAGVPAGTRAVVEVQGSGAFLERLVLLHDNPGSSGACVAVGAGDGRLRWLIVNGPGTLPGIFTSAYQRKCEFEECLMTTGANAGAPAVFRNCLFLGSAEAGHSLSYTNVPGIEVRFCTILGGVSCMNVSAPRDSILGTVAVSSSSSAMENCALLAGQVPEDSRGCFKADPMFVDPKNLDYRLKPGSPCIGKASDGGDIGCRYTPEMIEICKVALELRRRGILKF